MFCIVDIIISLMSFLQVQINMKRNRLSTYFCLNNQKDNKVKRNEYCSIYEMQSDVQINCNVDTKPQTNSTRCASSSSSSAVFQPRSVYEYLRYFNIYEMDDKGRINLIVL